MTLDEQEVRDLAEDVARQVLEGHPQAVADYRDGQDAAANYLLGQLMAATDGKADPSVAREAIDHVIEADAPEWPVSFPIYARPTDKTAIAERLWNHIPRWVDGPTEVAGRIPEFEFTVTVTKDGDFELTFAGWSDA